MSFEAVNQHKIDRCVFGELTSCPQFTHTFTRSLFHSFEVINQFSDLMSVFRCLHVLRQASALLLKVSQRLCIEFVNISQNHVIICINN